MEKSMSVQTLQRLPVYLNYLKSLDKDANMNISAKSIALALGLGEIQVRKDLASVSSGGKPKVGYVTQELMMDIKRYLGYDDVNDAVIIGAGKLGKALLSYEGFKDYGLNIVAAFDDNEDVVGTDESGKVILSSDKLEDLCRRMKIQIGIITVPVQSAQNVCDKLVNSGVQAIWNFAPTHLQVKPGILVKSENMAASLAVLSKHLKQSLFD